MKHEFTISYEMDMPVAIAIAVYLDCEHYTHIHGGHLNHVTVTSKEKSIYTAVFSWKLFGILWGQSQKSTYVAPATFINSEVKPSPRWLPSIHHLVRTKTTLNYYENPTSQKTLSELIVELDIPLLLYPMRKYIQSRIEKLKILKDLEDVAMVRRRALLFGRSNNSVYLKSTQFLLNKNEYVKYFGPNCEYLGDPSKIQRQEEWTDITKLDFPFVRDFVENQYPKYATLSHAEIEAAILQRTRENKKKVRDYSPASSVNGETRFPQAL